MERTGTVICKSTWLAVSIETQNFESCKYHTAPNSNGNKLIQVNSTFILVLFDYHVFNLKNWNVHLNHRIIACKNPHLHHLIFRHLFIDFSIFLAQHLVQEFLTHSWVQREMSIFLPLPKQTKNINNGRDISQIKARSLYYTRALKNWTPFLQLMMHLDE